MFSALCTSDTIINSTLSRDWFGENHGPAESEISATLRSINHFTNLELLLTSHTLDSAMHIWTTITLPYLLLLFASSVFKTSFHNYADADIYKNVCNGKRSLAIHVSYLQE
ncbi:unnamed protein product [Sphenostylis stenocarpa]|uniref:Uncharacterized protein n=1 Tax=Sphenostylis stenocarpa TaxID=92480 RepID=A0AA86RYQ1_9FABA|nr:unnamed protein product [Sphenostylis stenocarpa]